MWKWILFLYFHSFSILYEITSILVLIFLGLLHQCADPNFKVSVVNVGKPTITGWQKTKNITSYKSVKFDGDKLIFKRSFGVGEGVVEKITEGSFNNSIETISDYSSTCRQRQKSSPSGTTSLRGYLNLIVCEHCNQWFIDKDSLGMWLQKKIPKE